MAEPDLMLTSLAGLADQGAIERLSLTVLSHGALITGTMVPRDVYWSAVEEQLEHFAPEQGAFFGSCLAEMSESELPTDFPSLFSTRYLHLLDARVLMGDSAWPPADGETANWRCRLESIDAWTLGTTLPSTE